MNGVRGTGVEETAQRERHHQPQGCRGQGSLGQAEEFGGDEVAGGFEGVAEYLMPPAAPEACETVFGDG